MPASEVSELQKWCLEAERRVREAREERADIATALVDVGPREFDECFSKRLQRMSGFDCRASLEDIHSAYFHRLNHWFPALPTSFGKALGVQRPLSSYNRSLRNSRAFVINIRESALQLKFWTMSTKYCNKVKPRPKALVLFWLPPLLR